MGYCSYVVAELQLDPAKRKEILDEISNITESEATYFEWHLITLNEYLDQETMYVEIDGYDGKWYQFDEFIEWLDKYVLHGTISRNGEEIGDYEEYEWKADGKKYSGIMEIVRKEVPWKR